MNKKLVFAISGKKGHGKDTLGTAILEHAKARGLPVEHFNLADPLKREAAVAIAFWEKARTGSYYIEAMDMMRRDLDAHAEVWEPFIVWLQETYGLDSADAINAALLITARACEEPPEEPYRYDIDRYNEILAEMNDPHLKVKWRVYLQWWGTEYRRRLFTDSYWRDQAKAHIQAIADGTVVLTSDIRFPDEFKMYRQELRGFMIRIDRSPPPAPKGDGSENHPSETALDHLRSDEWDCYYTNSSDLNAINASAEVILLNAISWNEGPTPR
jgi:hypothetical protein